MTTQTGTRKMGEGTQTNAKIVTPTPDSLKSVLLADGQWHDIQNAEKVFFAVAEAQSPTNPDGLYASLRCEENGRSIVIPFRQIVGYSEQPSSQQGSQGQQGSGSRQGQFGTTQS